MAEDAMRDLLAWKVDGRTVEDWDSRWEPVPKNFDGPFSDLRNKVGLVRALVSGRTKYIMQATDLRGGGIQKILKRIFKSPRISPSRYGESLIRENLENVIIEFIIVGDTDKSSVVAKNLKNILILVHNPEWNANKIR